MDVCFFAGLVPPVFVVAVPSFPYVSFLSVLPVRRRPFRPPFLMAPLNVGGFILSSLSGM